MKRLQVILSILYWLVVGSVLWLGYVGDEQIDQASKTPVTHSAVRCMIYIAEVFLVGVTLGFISAQAPLEFGSTHG